MIVSSHPRMMASDEVLVKHYYLQARLDVYWVVWADDVRETKALPESQFACFDERVLVILNFE